MNVIDNMIEVKFENPDDFLKIKETLTRIGVASKKQKVLYQSCHILHKRGKYYIVHFKELFLLDGKPSNFSEEDKSRRNTVVKLLKEWNLLEVVDESKIEGSFLPMSMLKVIPFREKADWELVSKYNIGG